MASTAAARDSELLERDGLATASAFDSEALAMAVSSTADVETNTKPAKGHRELLEKVGLAVDSGGNNEALAASEGWGIERDQN
jgi:hypothetical protein